MAFEFGNDAVRGSGQSLFHASAFRQVFRQPDQLVERDGLLLTDYFLSLLDNNILQYVFFPCVRVFIGSVQENGGRYGMLFRFQAIHGLSATQASMELAGFMA